MKDIKKAYEGVEITMKEKEKIYNNIMDKRKKPFDFRILFSVGAMCLIVLGAFLLFRGTGNKLNNKNGRDYELENNYKKEIITNVEKYLEANDIDISELEDGEELVIESNKIVDSDKYKTCKGNLVIKRYYDSYSYDPVITCDGKETDGKNERKFILYSGVFDKTFEVDDYIVISSMYNVHKTTIKAHDSQKDTYIPLEEICDNDINITVFDKDGNVVLSKLIESKYTDEDSKMSVNSVNLIDGYYYVNLEVSHDRQFNEFGGGSEIVDSYEMIFDKDGNEVLYDKIIGPDGSQVRVDEYLGNEGDTVYYTGYYNGNVIIKITKDKIETVSYDVIKETADSRMIQYKLLGYYKDNYYGYGYIKSYDQGGYYAARDLVKVDKDGNLVWKKTIVPEGYNINKLIVKNDKVFVMSGYYSTEDGKDYHLMLTVTDLEGEVIKSVDVESLFKKLWNMETADFYVDDKPVVMVTDRQYGSKYFVVLDNKLNKLKVVDMNESSAAYNFEWSYLAFSRLNGDKCTNIYSVDNSFFNVNNTEAVLIVISNVTEKDIFEENDEVITGKPSEKDDNIDYEIEKVLYDTTEADGESIEKVELTKDKKILVTIQDKDEGYILNRKRVASDVQKYYLVHAGQSDICAGNTNLLMIDSKKQLSVLNIDEVVCGHEVAVYPFDNEIGIEDIIEEKEDGAENEPPIYKVYAVVEGGEKIEITESLE